MKPVGRLPKHRGKIIRATAELLRTQGYSATGTADIVARSGAPKGSLYHYFPGGKEEIAEAAVEHAGEVVAATIISLEEKTTADKLRTYARMLASWMDQSGCRDGCPIATTVLERAAQSSKLAAIGANAFRKWTDAFAAALRSEGMPGERASQLSRLAIVTLEGALILARAERDAGIIIESAEEVARLFERSV